ncbi:MAG: kelch repeat-containing protein [Candidatus Delongbacteria bacterium]|nr:kelch repeat-containing protein [Candidatus Delongbacteria bacterium]
MKFYIGLIFLITLNLYSQWSSLTEFPGSARRGSVSFVIGDKAYICTGNDGELLNDLWEYDLTNDVWSRKADFPPGPRWDAVGFSIGSKGYVGTGYTGSTHKKDFWEYNPETDTWTQMANFGGPGRREAVGFSIGTKGYIGTGYSTPAGTYYNDFWEYDQVHDVWNQKADFGGTKRDGAVGFSINDKGYIGTGIDLNENHYKDIWEYDPLSDVWTKKAYMGGVARLGAVGFAIGNKGYIVGGFESDYPYSFYNDFWEYDPSSDSWLRLDDLPGAGRFEAVGLSDGVKGYIVTGQTDDGYVKELWSYTVETGITEALLPEETVLYQNYPNPFNPVTQIRFALSKIAEVKLDVYNISGQRVAELASGTLNAGHYAVDFDGSRFNSGLYYYTLEVDGKAITREMVLTK